MGERGQRLGDPDHVLEGVDALIDVADVRLAAGGLDPQRDRAAARVPDHAAGGLGGEHRDRLGVDQAGFAEVSRPGDAARLLVADEVQHDPAVAQQRELASRQGAVEHAHQAALHVGGAASADPALAPLRAKLRRSLRRDDVEVAVEVDRARPVADGAAHDAGILQLADRRHLDQLRRQTELPQRLVQRASAAAEPATRRVLGVDRHELLQQRGHLIGPRLQPGLHLSGTVAHGGHVAHYGVAHGIEPFRLAVAEAELEDLRRAAERNPLAGARDRPRSQGVALAELQALVRYWADGYDWRALEARLNAAPQFRTTIDGLGIHFLHARSPHPDALPLVLTHGWPGSVVEFLDVLGPLTDPPARLSRLRVVARPCPAMRWSDKPAERRLGRRAHRPRVGAADGPAGYDRYGAQGSDWGTSVSASLGQQDPEHVAGIHLMPPLAPPDPATSRSHRPEQAALDAMAAARRRRRLLDRASHAAADDRLLAGRLPRRPGRVDHREAHAAGPTRASDSRGRDARQPDALLASRARAHRPPACTGRASATSRAGWKDRSSRPTSSTPRRAARSSRTSFSAPAGAGRATLPRHPLLERARPRRPLRRLRAARALRRRGARLLRAGPLMFGDD